MSLNLMKYRQPDIDQKKFVFRTSIVIKETGIKILKNSKTFIDYLQTIAHVYENLEGYNSTN